MPETLREQQYELARHLRDPDQYPPPPGLEDRRLKIYRELFFQSIQGQLAGSFPVLHQSLPEAHWLELVHGFYADYRSATPLFTEIAGEFVVYLQSRPEASSPPWLAELAHYEWVELALQLSDAPQPPHDPQGDLLTAVPVLSPLAIALAYQWPVTEIGPDHQPPHSPDEPTLLLVHRDANHDVQFARISALTYRLLVSLADHDWTGRQHLACLASEAGQEPATFETEGLALLTRLRDDGIVLGTHLAAEDAHRVGGRPRGLLRRRRRRAKGPGRPNPPAE